MRVLETALPEVLLIEPQVFRDARGMVFESYNRARVAAAAGIDLDFVQDNHSHSVKNVLRGLHYQVGRPQGKLVRVVRGEIYDVAVDLRPASPRFCRWVGFHLSEDNHRLAWIPPGFAHGFLVLSEQADVAYKMSEYWSPANERTIAWNDPSIGVRWPLSGAPLLSDKDRAGASVEAAVRVAEVAS